MNRPGPYRLTLVLVMVAWSGLAPVTAQEGEKVWLTGISGSAIVQNETVEAAKQRARLDAYGQALQRLGIPFNPGRFAIQAEAGESADRLRRANDAFLLVLRGRSEGFVSAVRNARTEVREQSGTVFCTTTLDARVTRPRGSVDHGFYVSITAAARTVVAGDDIRLRAIPSRESFLYIFHVMSDGLRLIYPPAIDSDVAIPAGTEVTVPSSAGGAWVAELPEDWESSEELIVAVATRTKIPEGSQGIVDPEGYRSAREGALLELMGWLSALPLEEVTESSIRVEIVRN